MKALIEYHRKQIRSVPPGSENEEILTGLRGKNPRKLQLIEDGHPKINEAGQLLDRFGTPYHFHPLSDQVIEIRSAGPDKKLWTNDDVALEDETGGEAVKNL